MSDQQRLFTPSGMLWRVHRENITMLAGARALLLELAHPDVAAGVMQHSDFDRRPLHRLMRTLRAMQQLSFGTRESARKAAHRIHQCHQPVHGVGPSGALYDANDPLLRLWVFATLVDSALVVYDKFICPLTQADRECFYQEAQLMGRMMGVPISVMPATYLAFTEYVNRMLADGTLRVGDTAFQITNALFHHPLLGGFLRLISFPGMGLLPEPLRSDFGIRWGAGQQRCLDRIAILFRFVRPFLPDLVAVQPIALVAELQEKAFRLEPR